MAPRVPKAPRKARPNVPSTGSSSVPTDAPAEAPTRGARGASRRPTARPAPPPPADAEPVAWAPDALRAFLLGERTLGELQGISKEQQYEMANIAFAHLEKGELSRAQELFRALSALDPFDAYFHTALGSVAQRLGDLEAADESYTRALEINPYSPVAFAHRGEVRVQRGLLLEAAADFTEAGKLDPTGQEPATRRAQVIAAEVLRQLQAAPSAG